MKKLFLLLFAFILLSAENHSQVIQNTLASQVRNEAFEAAVNDGLTEPKLIMIATVDIEIELFGLPVPLKFNMQNGTAGMWIYMFTDSGFDTFLAYMLIKPVIGSANAIPMDPEDIISEFTPISMDKTLDEFVWLDSDKAAEAFRGSTQFMDAYNNDHELFALALFVNGGIPAANIDEPYWGANVSSENDVTFCIMHAINSDIMCLTEASIIDDIVNNVSLFPNPAQEFINIEIEAADLVEAKSIQVFDALGNLQNVTCNLRNNSASIGISGIPAGTYFIRIGSKFYPFVKN